MAIAKQTRRKRISLADVEQIAFLTEAHRMNYREACALTGINYESWRSWKDRAKNEPLLADVVAHVKASWISGRLAHIADAETGKNGHRADWRSAAWLLERTTDRFSTQPAQPEPQSLVTPHTLNVWVSLAREQVAQGAKVGEVVDTQEVKALPEITAPEPPVLQDNRGREFWLEQAGGKPALLPQGQSAQPLLINAKDKKPHRIK